MSGPDLGKLGAFSQHIVERLRAVPGAVDVDSSLVIGRPEARVTINRDRASTLGVEPYDVASTLQLLVGGLKVSNFQDRGEDYDIKMRALREYRVDDRGTLMTVPSRTADHVQLDSVVDVTFDEGASKIERTGRRRVGCGRFS